MPNGELEISIRDLTKRFGDRLILDRINLTIQSGQTVALIGPSGGGKSTLLRCLNGLTQFDDGEIRVGAHTLRPDRRANGGGAVVHQLRRLFGMVFQDFQLFPHLSVLANVIEAPRLVLGLDHDAAVERARKLLKRVGLAEHENAWPQQLSGGQKQRVAIARALAMEPRGLLCDEITSALDPELKNEVLAVLEDLKREGMTLLMVTHEIGFARRAADRVLLLADGKIIEDGLPAEVLDQPKTPRARAFLRSVLG
ncbi:MAG: amino acid ABC transporter ATP-binding protein [Gemmataceae bacterium]|nr:amino acid ABC transporter ATP-binding protein [Gemmataceae bacterium]